MTIREKIMGTIQAIAIVIILIAFFCGISHCSVSTKQSNAFGAITYNENPYSYIAGSVIDGSVIGDKKGLVLRIQPMGTYELYTEDILFCIEDDTADKLNGKTNPVVITYETIAHRSVEDIGCHHLLRIDSLEQEKP